MDSELEVKFENLKTWITNNGGYVNNKLGIKYITSDNRTVYAKEPINQNEFIFKIPDKCLINENSFKTLPITGTIDHELSADAKRIIVLLYEKFIKRDKSFYYPYIDILPSFEDFNYHPFIKFDVSRETIYKTLSDGSFNKLNAFITLYNTIKDTMLKFNETIKLFNEDILTEENIKWAFLILRTRQWKNGLCPFADLLQHSHKSTMLLETNTTTQTNDMVVKNDIQTNEIIYDNYGIYDDVMLFVAYGFVNKQDHKYGIDFTIQVNDNNPLNLFKKELINKFILTNKNLAVSKNEISNQLIWLFRMASITNTDIKMINLEDNDFYKKEISLDNECMAYRNLLEILKIKIQDTNKSLELCKNIMNTYDENSIEYAITYLNINSNDIYKSVFYLINRLWNEKLPHPFNTNLTINL